MAEIKPFRALRYTEKAGDIANNVCPPYDVVNDEAYAELCKRSEYNFIRLERVEGEDGYARSAALLKKLIANGVMKKDEKPGYYIYEEEFVYEDKTYVFDGLVCLCRTYDYADNVVKPHEETLSKAKKDRFELMKATFCNFSSVYSLFEDRNGYIQNIMNVWREDVKPLYDFVSSDGIKQRLWKIEDGVICAAITGFFEPKQLFIADGHHRFETAGAFNKYCTENGIDCDSGYIMMTLVDMASTGLVVLPTHRVIVNMDIDIPAFLKKAEEYFDITDIDKTSDIKQTLASSSDKHAFVMYAKGGGARLLVLKEAVDVGDTAVSGLDVSVLHDLLLEKILKIDRENLKNQKNLVYTRDIAEAVEAVDSGASPAAFILNPTKVEQIRAVASEGGKMPQKSTYFYPKLIAGLTVNQFKEV
ncbi:MAG: DUF1015 domain-containing protein [Clostridia bacterium]|nr:DUF1015 domain-containing protein [Clostridia bacterium]